MQIIIAVISEDKITELFCMEDDFCKFFGAMVAKYTIKGNPRSHHRDSTTSKAEVCPLRRNRRLSKIKIAVSCYLTAIYYLFNACL